MNARVLEIAVQLMIASLQGGRQMTPAEAIAAAAEVYRLAHIPN